MEKFMIISKNNIGNLPAIAGVYAFYSKSLQATSYKLQPIYIGKAINIKSRVKNHFNQPSYRDNLFVGKVEKIGFLETGSEISALILEANLIKKYQPKYNVVWKDDKNYFYVAIAKNKLNIPYVFITHQPGVGIRNSQFGVRFGLPISNSKFQYVGPFVDGNALKKTVRFLRKAFPHYTNSKHSKLKCQYCHLDLCPGPDPDLAEYRKNIKKLILVLQGKSLAVLRVLKKEMAKASANHDFEKAGKIRDQIFALEKVMSHSRINLPTKKFEGPSFQNFSGRIEAYDISNIQGKFATGSMIVFTNGKPDKSQYKKFKIKMENKPNDIAMLKEVLQRRFSHPEWPLPNIILIDGGRAQLNVATISKSKFLISKKIQNIKIMAVAKGRQELFIENREKPIPIKDLPEKFRNLILNLDSEAHRFAITYHKKLRKQNLLK